MQWTSFKTNDFEELQDAAADWDQRYLQMCPGPFDGGIDMIQFGSRHIFRERWGRKTMYQGTAPQGSYGIALSFDQPGTGNWVGRPVGPDPVIVQAPGQEADMVSSHYWDALTLSVSKEEVHSIVSALSGRDDNIGNFCGALTLQPDVADRLRRLGRDFLREARQASDEDERQISRWSEQLVRVFLWEMVDALESPEFVVAPTRPANTVRLATELVLSDQTNEIELTEICAQLKVSLRTLHYAFQDVTGMPPATWLRRIRLNQVHKTLQRSSPDEIMVKRVALDNGFFHLGHFSRQYQRLFGCLPSQTLQSW